MDFYPRFFVIKPISARILSAGAGVGFNSIAVLGLVGRLAGSAGEHLAFQVLKLVPRLIHTANFQAVDAVGYTILVDSHSNVLTLQLPGNTGGEVLQSIAANLNGINIFSAIL